MKVFNRTTSGLVAKFQFHKEPVIWVEGYTDIPFYEPILRHIECRIEVAGGKQECLKLANELAQNNYPYVVILDGDYEIIERSRSFHRRVILLHRHSSENYLFEKEPLEQVCRKYVGIGNKEEVIGKSFIATLSMVEEKLRELLIWDIANFKENCGLEILPNRIEPLLESNSKIESFSEGRVSQLCGIAKKSINSRTYDEAETLLDNYLLTRRFIDILNGHLVFGISIYLIINSVKKKNVSKPNIDNKGWRMLISTEVWSDEPSKDHSSLKRRLRRAVNEAARLRGTQS